MLNFYRRFLPKAAQYQTILNAYLSGLKTKDSRVIAWSTDAVQAFELPKRQLADDTLLAFPQLDASLAVFVDALDNAVGAAHQKVNQTIAAAYMAIKYFRYSLEGRLFTVFTNHKPLTIAFKQKFDKAFQIRHLNFISQFTSENQHVSAKDNVVADALSRVSLVKIPVWDVGTMA